MSNELAQAVNDIQPFAKMFRAIIAIADAVESADAISDIEVARRRDVSVLDTAIAAKTTELDEVLAKKKNVETELEAHAESLAKAESDAKESAELILKKAQERADKLIDAAHNKVSDLQAELDNKKAELARVILETHDAESLYNEAAGKLQAKRDEIRAIAG